MSSLDRVKYGYKLGPLFWRANVTSAARLFGDAGWELRWIGIAIPFTNWGFGFLWRVRRSVPAVDGNEVIWGLHGMSPATDTPCEPRCDEEYCAGCAMAECPHGEPLHRHHDGCPACSRPEPATRKEGT